MNLCNPKNNAHFFSSVDEISEDIWEFLKEEKSVYFSKIFLVSIEKNHPNSNFMYLVLKDENNAPIAFVSIQIVDFLIEKVKNNIENLINSVKKIVQKFGIISAEKSLKLLICGNAFVSGEHGIFIKKGQNKQKIIKKIADTLKHLLKNKKDLKNEIDGFLFKDFKNKSLTFTNELKHQKYYSFSAEPNMVLFVNEKWQNFEGYLASLKTKFRVKAKKAFKQSSGVKILEVSLENIKEQLPKMTSLYSKVATNASFNLGTFNLETYIDLKSKFGKNYLLKTYWLNGVMVGFISGIINQDSLDAHFVGIDYKYNRSHGIYQRMLYHYIEIAIEKQLKIINFGRTASEIKSSVGAIPEGLTMYFRHKKTVTNKILKVFLHKIQPTPFRQNFPFKKE